MIEKLLSWKPQDLLYSSKVKVSICLVLGVIFGLYVYQPAILSLVALAAFFYVIHAIKNPRWLLIQVGCFYLGFFISSAHWVYQSIHLFGNFTPSVALLFSGIFFIFLALANTFVWLGYAYLKTDARRFLLPWIFVLAEIARTYIWVGFPWGYLGYSLIDTSLVGIAPFTGVLGMSLAGATLAAIPTMVKRHKLTFSVVAIVAALAIGAIADMAQFTNITGQKKVALLQLNRQPHQYLSTDHIKLSQQAAKADLVILPEGAVSDIQHINFANPVLFGAIYTDKDKTTYNSALLVSQGNKQLYHKRKLVPFGEFIPAWGRIIPLPLSDISAGSDKGILSMPDGQLISIFICYDFDYPDLVARDSGEVGAVVSISNDVWFGSAILLHHGVMARMRALETQKTVVRVDNVGKSRVIDSAGRVLAELAPRRAGEIVTNIDMRQGFTPFSNYGNAGIFLLMLGWFILWLVLLRRFN